MREHHVGTSLALLSVMRKWIVVVLLSCSSGGVDSNDAARAAYLGLDRSVDKAITLGFDGFNAASSANIPEQQTTGDSSGTMKIDGQADQGASANKTMRLQQTLINYADTDAGIIYTTGDAGPAELDMDLKGIPNGTVTGSLAGSYDMTDALKGPVTLAISFNGQLQPGDAGVERAPGTIHITGTATSGSSTFTIDVTR